MPDDNGNDKPFDDEPFDAGVEANEEQDPKKFIQQLSGKLGTSLRKYNEQNGQPDFELEKFAINSVLSATHTSKMDDQDQNDIIKKVKTSGQGDDNSDNQNTNSNDNTENGEEDINVDSEENDNSMGQEEENFDENLKMSKNSSIFVENVKDIIMKKLNEDFDVDSIIDEVLGDHTNTEPTTKPDEKTIKKPQVDDPRTNPKPRRERIWSPTPGVSPDPKAEL